MQTFLAETDSFTLPGILIPLVVITLSMSIPIVAIIAEHLQKKERMRLIHKAIEHGVNPDDLKLEQTEQRPRLPYRSGMVSLAVGVGMVLSDRFLDFGFGSLHFPLQVGGLITGCVGVALLLNDWLNRGRINQGKG